jgi:hypothetical protein
VGIVTGISVPVLVAALGWVEDAVVEAEAG